MILLIAIATAQFILLVMFYRLGWRIYQRLGEMNRAAPETPAIANPAPVAAPSIPIAPTDAPVIWDVLLKRHGEWVAVSKVREGTTAWGNATRTHNMALRSPSGEFIEGKPE